jgi:hypothetical protein
MESVPPWQFVAMLRRSIDEVLVQKKKISHPWSRKEFLAALGGPSSKCIKGNRKIFFS